MLTDECRAGHAVATVNVLQTAEKSLVQSGNNLLEQICQQNSCCEALQYAIVEIWGKSSYHSEYILHLINKAMWLLQGFIENIANSTPY